MATKLLKGGLVLQHDAAHNITSSISDILITGSTITKIAPSISPPPGTQVLDCTGKLLTPGFVDTHHHLSDTALKGRHADHTLLEYFVTGLVPGSLHTADDAFWATLAGALETLDAGTTTVVEHTLCLNTPAHAFSTARATALSGIRAFYCYGVNFGIEKVMPVTFSRGPPEWAMSTFDQLASLAPFADGRVQLGFAFDLLFLPKQMLQPMFARARKSAKLFTHHDSRMPMMGGSASGLEELLGKELLGAADGSGAPTILSHANSIPLSRQPDMSRFNVEISITPTTELAMGMGNPMPVALRVPEWDGHCSLGIDCRSMVSAFLPGQAREMMGAARAHKHASAWSNDKWFRSLGSAAAGSDFPTARRAFNMMTVGGARAVGLQDSIGQLREGFKADVVVWDASSPGMAAAVEHDPVAAVVMHSSVRDVAGVLVDGAVRKWDGKLAEVDITPRDAEPLAQQYALPVAAGVQALAWRDVVAKLLQTQRDVVERERAAGVKRREQQDDMIQAFHMPKEKMIE